MPDLVQIVEGNTLADFVRRIDPLVEHHSRSGIAIARQFAGAEASLNLKDFKALRDRYGLSYSTARKLVKVGNSDRIKS
jgi:hypothetical protein